MGVNSDYNQCPRPGIKSLLLAATVRPLLDLHVTVVHPAEVAGGGTRVRKNPPGSSAASSSAASKSFRRVDSGADGRQWLASDAGKAWVQTATEGYPSASIVKAVFPLMQADFLFPIFLFFQEGAADGVEVKYNMAQLPGWAKVILDFAIRMKADQDAPGKKDRSRALVGFPPANAGPARVICLT